ncbi:unnamed protein product [Oikopleura dioica]|uniref:Uncharacterized protein n=1 Tax=Oikopleura dioica TaxID=34765 RepID=E4Y0P1_OIKDI|nr:unnamed protein product [Oikopleura dioica]
MKLLHVFLLLSYQPANAKTKVSKPVQKIKKKQNEKIRNKNAEHFEVFQTENSLVAEKRKQLLKSLDESIGVLGKFKKSKIVNLESRVNAIRGYCEGFDFKNAIEISQKNNDQDLKKKLSDTRDICTSTLDFMKTEQMNLRLIEMKNGGKLLHEFIKDKERCCSLRKSIDAFEIYEKHKRC